MQSKTTRSRARKLRKKRTDEESILWSALRDYEQFPARFRRQHPLGPYIVDFYSRRAKLVIELDGEQRTSAESMKYDTKRTRYLSKLGLKVIRFWNHAIWREFKQIQEIIYEECERRMEAP